MQTVNVAKSEGFRNLLLVGSALVATAQPCNVLAAMRILMNLETVVRVIAASRYTGIQ